MTTKVRKQVYLEPEQNVALKRLSKETGVSTAEIIRRAIDQHTRQVQPRRRDPRAWEDERDYILRLISLGPVAGGRTWRREDLYGR